MDSEINASQKIDEWEFEIIVSGNSRDELIYTVYKYISWESKIAAVEAVVGGKVHLLTWRACVLIGYNQVYNKCTVNGADRNNEWARGLDAVLSVHLLLRQFPRNKPNSVMIC